MTHEQYLTLRAKLGLGPNAEPPALRAVAQASLARLTWLLDPLVLL